MKTILLIAILFLADRVPPETPEESYNRYQAFLANMPKALARINTLKTQKNIPALIDAMLVSDYKEVRSAATAALGEIPDKAAAEGLLKWLGAYNDAGPFSNRESESSDADRRVEMAPAIARLLNIPAPSEKDLRGKNHYGVTARFIAKAQVALAKSPLLTSKTTVSGEGGASPDATPQPGIPPSGKNPRQPQLPSSDPSSQSQSPAEQPPQASPSGWLGWLLAAAGVLTAALFLVLFRKKAVRK